MEKKEGKKERESKEGPDGLAKGPAVSDKFQTS
jgi:hypothetical protein